VAYSTAWADIPEVEGLPNNFRRAVAGFKTGANRIRMVHPSGTPLHTHETEEQMVFMLEGAMQVQIASETFTLVAGEVCVIPAGIEHCFRSIADEVVFIETFSPMRVQNLVGFLGKVF
jgi:quercetin dioxygenase-like cupin family protein